jgi:hypothetical protein
LVESSEVLGYLACRRIDHGEAIEVFQLGYANRTLGYRLPHSSSVAGGELRGRLQRLGVIRESGHEHFRGSLVVPVINAGEVSEVYGRKVLDNLRAGTPKHLYLPGPHRGVWNLDAFSASDEIIVCESLIDALSLWCWGFRHVTAAYGVEGFTADHWQAIDAHRTRQVLVAFDADEAGDKAARRLARQLLDRGVEGSPGSMRLRADSSGIAYMAMSPVGLRGSMTSSLGSLVSTTDSATGSLTDCSRRRVPSRPPQRVIWMMVAVLVAVTAVLDAPSRSANAASNMYDAPNSSHVQAGALAAMLPADAVWSSTRPGASTAPLMARRSMAAPAITTGTARGPLEPAVG